ncbi:proline dehydrogenase [Paenibacillus swuensis]|uniref:proline dehydrogenase n=1 Tax=Paenibacillus swuensis TaxID=1178515 RepID=A0A172TNC7_9BACL|nr:proline dehydrogenase family protein [Paenibacillus swuensis]ANE48530.1 proline dehydrogenase [Paenibacillus swuensis]
MSTFFRKTILFGADLPVVKSFFTKYGMRLVAHRFVAHEQLSGACAKVAELNQRKLTSTLDFLGESVYEEKLAIDAADMVLRTFDSIANHQLKSNVSVKLTQLGLSISPELCLKLMRKIAAKAREHGNFVRIDMEDSPITQQTIDIYTTLRNEFGNAHVGLVLQSYLYRTEDDLRKLAPFKPNLRMVKGAYREPASVAYPRKADVDANYVKLVKAMLDQGCYAAVATHDVTIIDQVKAYAAARQIGRDRFEFQMLYGISTSLQQQLADEGYTVRVYTPFGEHWYPYFTRRLAERPANLLFVLKGMLRK